MTARGPDPETARTGRGQRDFRILEMAAETSPAAEGGGLGHGAPLRARGGVRAQRPPCRRARPCARTGLHRGRRARGRGPGEGRIPARRRHAGRAGFARDGPHRRRGARDRGAHARGPGARACHDAKLDGPGASQPGAAHARAEGRGEAGPFREGPGRRRAGLRRHRQDHHAGPGEEAGGEEGMAHGGPRALGLGGADPGLGGRNPHGDAPEVPRPQRGRRGGQAHAEGRARDAGGVREDGPGGGRGLARLTVQARDLLRIARELRIPASSSSGTRSSSTRSTPASPSPSSRPPA